MSKTKIIAALLLIAVTAVFGTACTEVKSDISANADTTASDVSTDEKTGAAPPSFTVIIDPGHGFEDPGSHPKYIYCDEKELTMRAALLLKEKLNGSGIKTVLTHDGESFPSVRDIEASAKKYNVDYDSEKMIDNDIFSVYERVIYANTLTKALGNCFFVSLHTNSIEDSPTTCGLSIDYYENSPFRSQLSSFCYDFKNRVTEHLGKNTVIFEDEEKEAYVVNKYCLSPSVLIEMGYGSNPQDGNDLMNEVWLDSFCSMLADCIADNKELLQK